VTISAVSAARSAGATASAPVNFWKGFPLNSRLLPVSSARRLLAGLALVAGFAAVSTPARADDGTGTTTIGGYTVSTAPTGSTTDPSSYGKAGDGTTTTDPNSYGKADDGTTSTSTTTTSPDSYGKS
jgi:hypothetical protein